MKQITLTLSLEQGQLILTALSKLPYEQSAALINEIQKQAAPQLEEKPNNPLVESNGNTET